MKKVYRSESNIDYWNRRWSESGTDAKAFLDPNIYPVKYSNLIVQDKTQCCLEIGSGVGRILKHYFYQGFNITGIERSNIGVDTMLASDNNLPVQIGDAVNLPYADSTFDNVLAFGVFHNIEDEVALKTSISQCSRVLKPSGRFCISIRPDNLEMNLNEWYWKISGYKKQNHGNDSTTFHRWLFKKNEFKRILSNNNLHTVKVHAARNVSILYRIKWLRTQNKDETYLRSNGYKLNFLGASIDRLLTFIMPNQFCNVFVFIGEKRPQW
jgi:SAM-dependent methyltransferase